MHELTLPVAELIGRPGEYADVTVARPLDGVGTALARLSAAPVVAHLRAESVVEGILVTGPVTTAADLQCARCLAPFRAPVTLEVCEMFFGPGYEDRADDPAYVVAGWQIDLEPMLRDAVALALPANPVCAEDCKGLCATCGRDLNVDGCDCAADDVDPRWAPLAALRDRLEA